MISWIFIVSSFLSCGALAAARIVYRDRRLRRGTLPSARRASDRPIAMACFLLVTFLPERPLLNVPRLRSRITFRTFFCAVLPYFAIKLLSRQLPGRQSATGRVAIP